MAALKRVLRRIEQQLPLAIRAILRAPLKWRHKLTLRWFSPPESHRPAVVPSLRIAASPGDVKRPLVVDLATLIPLGDAAGGREVLMACEFDEATGVSADWLLSEQALGELSRRPPSAETVAVWLRRGTRACFDHRESLRNVDLLLAPDAESCALASMLHPRCVVAEDSNRWLRRYLDAEVSALASQGIGRDPAPRVLLQVQDFTSGGLEQVVSLLASAFRKRGVPVFALILGRRGSAVERLKRTGVPVLDAVSSEADYLRLLRTHSINVVSSHFSTFGAGCAAAEGVRFVQTIHNTYLWLHAREIVDYRRADSATAAYASVSATAAWYAAEQLGLNADKMVVVPNGVDVKRFSAPVEPAVRMQLRNAEGFGPEDFVFVNVASIQASKAQRELVEATAIANRSRPVKVAIAGAPADEAYAADVRRRVERRGLQSAVKFLGHRDPVECLALADAFVLPSFWEGWSLALTEAVASGLPFVAGDVGGARELAAIGEGLVVRHPLGLPIDFCGADLWRLKGYEQRDYAERLAAAMIETTSSRSRKTLDRAALESLDFDATAAGHLSLFSNLVAGRSPGDFRHRIGSDAVQPLRQAA